MQNKNDNIVVVKMKNWNLNYFNPVILCDHWYFYFLNFLLFFWLCHAACRILVPQAGIEPTPPAMEVQNLNHWTVREVPTAGFLIWNLKFLKMKQSASCEV